LPLASKSKRGGLCVRRQIREEHVSYIKGRMTKEKPPGKPEKTFKIDGKLKPEDWAEFYRRLKELLDEYGIKLKDVK
jgi:hypothetical protein